VAQKIVSHRTLSISSLNIDQFSAVLYNTVRFRIFMFYKVVYRHSRCGVHASEWQISYRVYW